MKVDNNFMYNTGLNKSDLLIKVVTEQCYNVHLNALLPYQVYHVTNDSITIWVF